MPDLLGHYGGSHCGHVRFALQAPAALAVDGRNCSMCSRCGWLQLMVEASRYTLLCGELYLAAHRVGTHAAQNRCLVGCAASSRSTSRARTPTASASTHAASIPGSVISDRAAIRRTPLERGRGAYPAPT